MKMRNAIDVQLCILYHTRAEEGGTWAIDNQNGCEVLLFTFTNPQNQRPVELVDTQERIGLVAGWLHFDTWRNSGPRCRERQGYAILGLCAVSNQHNTTL